MVVSYFFIFFKKIMTVKCKGMLHNSRFGRGKNFLFPILYAYLIRLRDTLKQIYHAQNCSYSILGILAN